MWTFEPEDGGTHVRFDWNIVAEKPLLKYLSFLLKPIFRGNHAWAMRRGEESLAREIERRRGRAVVGRTQLRGREADNWVAGGGWVLPPL